MLRYLTTSLSKHRHTQENKQEEEKDQRSDPKLSKSQVEEVKETRVIRSSNLGKSKGKIINASPLTRNEDKPTK